MNGEGPSARRLREHLTRDDATLRALLTDAAFHMQAALTCELLDVVDEVADPETAAAITDRMCELLPDATSADLAMRYFRLTG